jgi:hypothetical protein
MNMAIRNRSRRGDPHRHGIPHVGLQMKKAAPVKGTHRALSRIKRLRREGEALLRAETIDQYRYGRWCQRVERYLEPLNYGGPSILDIDPPRSPLDTLYAKAPRPSREEAMALRNARSKRVVCCWMVSLAGAMERLELEASS